MALFCLILGPVFLLSQPSILRRPDEHFHEIIVKSVIELALETPLELRVIEVARMKLEVVSVNRNRRVLELNDDLNSFALRACREL